MLRVVSSPRQPSSTPKSPSPGDVWAAHVQEMAKRFPEWTLVGSPLKGLWAASKDDPVPNGCEAFLAADTPAEMVDLLIAQEALRGRGQA